MASQALGPDPAMDAMLFKTSENKRSIPEAVFIEDVEAMCKDREHKTVLARIQELYTKYQYMQSSLVAQKSGLKSKLPDISSALESVQHLVAQREKGDTEAEYTYQLSENLWSKAVVEPTNNVCLWLGANVMMEYTLDEALELLRTNEFNAKETLIAVEEDILFLRDQLTTTEVNIARVHNLGVKLRNKDKEAGTNEAAKAEPSATGAPSSFKPAARATDEKEKEKAYTWKQDADEIEISVPVPSGAQKSDIKVTILAESVKVEHSGKLVLEGQFAGRCSPNGSTWTLNKGKVEITLEKAEPTSWPSLFES